ncbi:13135_t:CDS:1, partial [Racocetra fulgida]
NLSQNSRRNTPLLTSNNKSSASCDDYLSSLSSQINKTRADNFSSWSSPFNGTQDFISGIPQTNDVMLDIQENALEVNNFEFGLDAFNQKIVFVGHNSGIESEDCNLECISKNDNLGIVHEDNLEIMPERCILEIESKDYNSDDSEINFENHKSEFNYYPEFRLQNYFIEFIYS